MSSVLNVSFIRSVTKRVEDCSNPIQLREYLNRYKTYIFTKAIQDVFLERIEFFRDQFMFDTLHTEACDELQDALETEIMIAKVTGGSNLLSEFASNNHDKNIRSIENNINLLFLRDDCIFEYAPELELIQKVFKMTNGNKVDICRILDIDNAFLNDKIDQYTLKEELNEIRRVFRNSNKRG